MKDFYMPFIQPAYVQILSKNGFGRLRFEWFKRKDVVKTIRDYAEHLKFEFNNEIQSEHFGASRNLPIEGCYSM
jgi:hypothetical protein